MAPTAKTVFIAATKRDLDRNGRVRDKLIDLCRLGAVKDRTRVVITRPRPSRTPNATPLPSTPVIEISPQGDVIDVNAAGLRLSFADALPEAVRQKGYEWRRSQPKPGSAKGKAS